MQVFHVLMDIISLPQTESVEDGGGGSGSGGGDGSGGGSGRGGGSGASDSSTSSHSSGCSGGGGGGSNVAEEAPTKVARVNTVTMSSRSTIVQDDGVAETSTHTSTTTSRFSTATTKVKTIKIVKKTSPLIANAISDLNSRAEASHSASPPRRPLAGGPRKVVRPIKIQQEAPAATKASSKDVPKAVDGKLNDVKVKETKVEVVKETSVAGASASPAVNSENTSEAPGRAVTIGNARVSENEASCGASKVVPITRKGSPGPKQASKGATTTIKTNKSITNTKDALRPKRRSSPSAKTEESTRTTSQDTPNTQQTTPAAAAESVKATPTEDVENTKISTASSSTSVSSSSSVSSSASTSSVSSSKTVKAAKVKKPTKAKKQESTELTNDDTNTNTSETTAAAAAERVGLKEEKVANNVDAKTVNVADNITKGERESNDTNRTVENGLEGKDDDKTNNESCTSEVKESIIKDESKEATNDVQKDNQKESKASCENTEENGSQVENDTHTSQTKDNEVEREESEKKKVSKTEIEEVVSTAKKDEENKGESQLKEEKLTNGERVEDEEKQQQQQEQQQQQQQQEQDVTSPPPPPPPPPPPSTKKIKPIGKVKSREPVTIQDITTEDDQTAPHDSTSIPEISVSGEAASSTDVPKIDINGDCDKEEDTQGTSEEAGTVGDWEPKGERDAEEPELASVCVVVRDMSGVNTTVIKVTLAMAADSTCGQLMAEVGRRFKYDPDSFSLVLQCSDGDQVSAGWDGMLYGTHYSLILVREIVSENT